MQSYFQIEQFAERNPRYQKFKDNDIAQKIYEDILSKGENIYRMQVFTSLELPALAACIKEIEEKFSDQNEFTLDDHYNKSALGVMVKDILSPFGYAKDRNKNIPKGLSDYVGSASVYEEKEGESKFKLIKNFSFFDIEEEREFEL